MILPLIGTLTFVKGALILMFTCFMGVVLGELYRFIKEKI